MSTNHAKELGQSVDLKPSCDSHSVQSVAGVRLGETRSITLDASFDGSSRDD